VNREVASLTLCFALLVRGPMSESRIDGNQGAAFAGSRSAINLSLRLIAHNAFE
jgi:hypothetical protein